MHLKTTDLKTFISAINFGPSLTKSRTSIKSPTRNHSYTFI